MPIRALAQMIISITVVIQVTLILCCLGARQHLTDNDIASASISSSRGLHAPLDRLLLIPSPSLHSRLLLLLLLLQVCGLLLILIPILNLDVISVVTKFRHVQRPASKISISVCVLLAVAVSRPSIGVGKADA